MPNYKRSPCLYYSKRIGFRQAFFVRFVEKRHSEHLQSCNFVKTDEQYTICNYWKSCRRREIVRFSHDSDCDSAASCIVSAAKIGVRANSIEPFRQIISPIFVPRETGAVRNGGSDAVTVQTGGLPYHVVRTGASFM